MRQLAAPLQLQPFVLHVADVHHLVVAGRVGGGDLAIAVAHVKQRGAQQHVFLLETPTQFVVPAQFRLGAERVADVVQHVVWRRAHVARQVVEHLIFLVHLVAGAEVRQEFMIGGFALLRHVVQAAAVVPFALHVLIGQAADEGPVRRGEPGVLQPHLLRRGDGVLVAPLNGVAVGVLHLIGSARLAPNLRRVAVALDADERLSLQLARALIPVADVQAVLLVDVPLQLGGDARPPGLGPRRAVVGVGFQVAEIVLPGLAGGVGQHRRRLAVEAAAVAPVVIRLQGQRQVVAQLQLLGERQRKVLERVAFNLVVLVQLPFAVVFRRGGVVGVTAVVLELRLAQGVVVGVVLAVVLHHQIAAVAVAVFVQRIHLELVGVQPALAAPFLRLGMRIGEPVAEAVVLAGIQAGEGFAQAVAAQRLLEKTAEVFRRAARHQADIAAAGADVRAVRFGGALGNEHLLQVFRVAQQVRVHRVVAGVVDWNAVHRQTDLIRVHAAHGVVHAAQAAGVVAVDVQARRVFQLVDGVGRRRHFVHRLFGDGRTRLGAVILHHHAAAERLPLDADGADIGGVGRQRGARQHRRHHRQIDPRTIKRFHCVHPIKIKRLTLALRRLIIERCGKSFGCLPGERLARERLH